MRFTEVINFFNQEIFVPNSQDDCQRLGGNVAFVEKRSNFHRKIKAVGGKPALFEHERFGETGLASGRQGPCSVAVLGCEFPHRPGAGPPVAAGRRLTRRRGRLRHDGFPSATV